MASELQRLRHDIRVRVLEVAGVDDITPRMRRITLAGPELEGFSSPGHADHVKVFFPGPGQQIVRPEIGPDGVRFPDGRPEARDYTPRYHDPEAGTLVLDFVLHGDGPASGWAAQAAIGQELMIGGPRGSLIVPDDFDWFLLAGDETALPAIGRRIEELPAGKKVLAVIEVADAAEEQSFATAADLDLAYVHRNGAEPGTAKGLLRRIAETPLPGGECYAFLAGEAERMREIRAHLVGERGFDERFVKAAGYWLRGTADAHEPH